MHPFRTGGGLAPPLDEDHEWPEYPSWSERLSEFADLLAELESARAGEAAALERVAELEERLGLATPVLGLRVSEDLSDEQSTCPPQWVKEVMRGAAEGR